MDLQLPRCHRPHSANANQTAIEQATEPPPAVLYNQTTVSLKYAGRISVTDKKVTLHSVRMWDEGSYIVLDREGKIKRRNCLNVRGERRDLVSPLQRSIEAEEGGAFHPAGYQ